MFESFDNNTTQRKRNDMKKNKGSVNKSIIEELGGVVKPNFKNVSQAKPKVKLRTQISLYTVEAPKVMSKNAVSRIQSVNKVLEQIATGEDPDIIFEHIEPGDNHQCEKVNHYYKIKTF